MGARAWFRRGSIGVGAIAAVLLLPPAAQAATGPDSQTQPLADGCQRNPSGLLTFKPGQTRLNIAVTIMGDRTPEADERFFVNLSHASVAVARGQGVGTIVNDD